MRIRKEPALFVIVAALGAWIWLGGTPGKWSATLRAKEKTYDAAVAPRDCLAPLLATSPEPGRDTFREPSETTALPPTELLFPPLPPLSVVALPLDPGQAANAYAQLRIPGGTVEQFAIAERGGDATENGAKEGAKEPQPSGEQDPPAVAASPDLTFDRVKVATGQEYYGFVRNPDKYDLEGTGPFRQTVILDWVNKETGKVMKPGFELAVEDLRQVRLADNLRNKVERRKRSLGTGAGANRDRIAFVNELLDMAQLEDWVFQEALIQADLIVAAAPDDPSGYRMKANVFRAQSDLGKEYSLYQSLPPALADSSFQHLGLGLLKARLRMDIEAEQHLRRAVEKLPADPRARMALADYLCQHGQCLAALEHAQIAHTNRGLLNTDEEQFDAIGTLLRVQLGLGRAEEVVGLLAQLPTDESFAARRSILAGAVEYARGVREPGAREKALSRFATAREAGGGGHAALAHAACLQLDGKWQAAEAEFRDVADQYPLLRARALAGLGLLYERTSNAGQMLAPLEAAYSVDPRDAYVVYLLGRARRLAGQLEGAVEALRTSLQLRDSLIEAMAELTMVYLEMAEAAPEQAAEHLYKARQYVDRLVELDAEQGAVPGRASLEYRILQGIVAFRARDLKAARVAFESGRDENNYCRVGLAIVDYAQNRVDEANGVLQDLKENLRPDDPMRVHAETLMAVIADHAEKQQLRDGFERLQLGANWPIEQCGTLKPYIEDGRLVVRGKFGSPAKVVKASRILEKAGNFIGVETTIQLRADHNSKFAWLALSTQSQKGRSTDSDFRVEFGFRERSPYLRIVDGRTPTGDPPEPVKLDLELAPFEPHRLALQVIPKDEQAKSFVLQATIDGQLVHEQELNRLRAGTSQELSIDLGVEGITGQQADVSFDDFRLVRRKDKS